MTANNLKINAKSVAKYVLLPGIIPRAKELGGTGFGYLAFLFAQVYLAVRILPPTHPFLQVQNIGRYGLRDVIAVAANNVKFTKGNIDQIIVFFAVLAGVVLLVLQALLFVLMLLSGTAFAAEGDAPFQSMFRTENPETDIAFLMLDHVFGIPDLFGSNALGEQGPTPFHQGLHALFEFYNLAILLVAALVFVYYVFVVVIETAQTGVPFGRRFSKIYAPFRLIAAVALLVPLNYGFNGAQYITFYAAKLGSSFATNGWILYNENVSNPMGVDKASLVAGVRPPEIDGLFQFASIYHACRTMHALIVPTQYGRGRETVQIKPYIIIDGEAKEWQSFSYDDANEHFGNSDIEILLGEYDKERWRSYAGGVNPLCGTMTIYLSSDNPVGYSGNGSGHGAGSGGEARGGVRTIEMEYYQLIRRLLTDDTSKFAILGERAAFAYVTARNIKDGGKQNFCHRESELGDKKSCGVKSPFPSLANLQSDIDHYKTSLQTAIDIGTDELRNGLDLGLTEEMAKYGWGGAGMWYNQIAEINGSATTAIYAAPTPRKFPEVMEEVRKINQATNTEQGQCQTFDPNLADQEEIDFRHEYDYALAVAGNELFKYWCEGGSSETGLPRSLTGNAVRDVIGALFGINGIFSLREDTQMNPETYMPKTHPLAALTAIGKSLVENAIRSMAISIGFSVGSGMSAILGQFSAAMGNISAMFVSVATLGLTAGFILYYILPFLPFIFFFFAVGSWVKSIFEAMVGAPLWALAHLNIEGDGFSGQKAASGYFLMFEIFLRPIVTVFGLIGGMAVFGASVSVLNNVFDVVVGNIVGDVPTDETGKLITVNGFEFARLGLLDQFLFTMMYTILVYLIANASFKMIDTIPKAFMRWIGSPVSMFNDNTGDPTSNLTTYTAIAGNTIVPQIFGNINKGASTIGGVVGGIGAAARNAGKAPETPPAQ